MKKQKNICMKLEIEILKLEFIDIVTSSEPELSRHSLMMRNMLYEE